MHYDSRTGRPSDLIGASHNAHGATFASDPKGRKPLRLELPMRDAETYDLVRKQESDHRRQGEQEFCANTASTVSAAYAKTAATRKQRCRR